jgi:hypothetical protein
MSGPRSMSTRGMVSRPRVVVEKDVCLCMCVIMEKILTVQSWPVGVPQIPGRSRKGVPGEHDDVLRTKA